MGDTSGARCLRAISSQNSANSSSLSWTRLSLRNDQPLMVSNRCWCSTLRNLCLSRSTSACGVALEPSPVVSFLDLFVGSFLRAISYKDTFVKLIYKKQQLITIKTKSSNNGAHFFPTTRKCQYELNSRCMDFSRLYIYLCTHIFFLGEKHFMRYTFFRLRRIF